MGLGWPKLGRPSVGSAQYIQHVKIMGACLSVFLMEPSLHRNGYKGFNVLSLCLSNGLSGCQVSMSCSYKKHHLRILISDNNFLDLQFFHKKKKIWICITPKFLTCESVFNEWGRKKVFLF